MEIIRARALFDHVSILSKVLERNTLTDGLSKMSIGSSAEEILILANLFSEANDEVSRTHFRSKQQQEVLLSRLSECRDIVLNALVSRGGGNTQGKFVPDLLLEKLQNIAEQLEEKDVAVVALVDRKQMILSTEEMIEDINRWNISEYARKSLVIKMNAIQRIIQASSNPSPSEIRLRVKEIIADFNTEFTNMDKEQRTMLEAITKWGKGLFVGGVFVLGLTSDISSVAGLLMPPVAALPSP